MASTPRLVSDATDAISALESKLYELEREVEDLTEAKNQLQRDLNAAEDKIYELESNAQGDHL